MRFVTDVNDVNETEAIIRVAIDAEPDDAGVRERLEPRRPGNRPLARVSDLRQRSAGAGGSSARSLPSLTPRP